METKRNYIFSCIREGLLNISPIILIGAIALLICSFPVTGYQVFINSFAGGLLYKIFNGIYEVTFGVLSLYLTISISIRYSGKSAYRNGNYAGTILASVCVFFILTDAIHAENVQSLGVNGVFTAMVSGLGGSALFVAASRRHQKRMKIDFLGADASFSNAFRQVAPLVETVGLIYLLNMVLTLVSDYSCFQNLYVSSLTSLFSSMGRNAFSGFVYITMVHVLWIFGIHGSNVFQYCADNIFQPAVYENMQMLQNGQVPDQIFSKGFFDISSLMGGSGTSLCLVIALLLFSKRKYNKELATLSIFPGLFNINEPLLFGLPIVLNPILAIPFLMTPLFGFITSSLSMYLGWVPVVVRDVEWTTPIFLSGYLATGSYKGALLQLFNLICGIMIYKPFVQIMDKKQYQNKDLKMHRLVDVLKESENTRIPIRLMQRTDDLGELAKYLGEELDLSIVGEEPIIFYQPQFNEKGICIGVEGLYRWNHEKYGMIYPPLVFQLALEMDVLLKLEENIFKKVIADCSELLDILGEDAKISVNVTGHTVQRKEYGDFLENMAHLYPQYVGNIMIEITEQASIKMDDTFTKKLNRIKKLGFKLAIDDFTMGNTSIQYLQTNAFSMIKLDGALIKDIITNTTSQGITESLAKLSQEFGLMILAEYVEKEEQRKVLEELGCNLYQGTLYSNALALTDLKEFVCKHGE